MLPLLQLNFHLRRNQAFFQPDKISMEEKVYPKRETEELCSSITPKLQRII